jgi:Tfp pilus assembly protein FimT
VTESVAPYREERRVRIGRASGTGHAIGYGGFTMVELSASLAVVALVLLMGAPSLANLLARTRLDGATSALVNHMSFARAQAVSQGVQVSLCSSADGRTCSGDLDWRSGWIVFCGPPGEAGSIGANDLIRVAGAAGEGVHLRASRASFGYRPDGSLTVR